MLRSESKSISMCTVWRKLKGLRLNSCEALGKLLISEGDQKKRLQFPGGIKIEQIFLFFPDGSNIFQENDASICGTQNVKK